MVPGMACQLGAAATAVSTTEGFFWLGSSASRRGLTPTCPRVVPFPQVDEFVRTNYKALKV